MLRKKNRRKIAKNEQIKKKFGKKLLKINE